MKQIPALTEEHALRFTKSMGTVACVLKLIEGHTAKKVWQLERPFPHMLLKNVI